MVATVPLTWPPASHRHRNRGRDGHRRRGSPCARWSPTPLPRYAAETSVAISSGYEALVLCRRRTRIHDLISPGVHGAMEECAGRILT
jgi:hypothetical protein